MPRNGSSPTRSFSSYATYAPVSTNAPWARLTTFITPQTRENPTATRPKMQPCSRPYNVACKNWLTTEPPGRPVQECSHDTRELDRTLRRVARPDRDRLATLDLDHGHLLGDVLTLVVELDRAE